MDAVGEMNRPRGYAPASVAQADVIERLTAGIFDRVKKELDKENQPGCSKRIKPLHVFSEVVTKGLWATSVIYLSARLFKGSKKNYGFPWACTTFFVRLTIAYGIPHLAFNLVCYGNPLKNVSFSKGIQENVKSFAKNFFTGVSHIKAILGTDANSPLDLSYRKIEEYLFRSDPLYQHYLLLVYKIAAKSDENYTLSSLHEMDEELTSSHDRGFVSAHRREIYHYLTTNDGENFLLAHYIRYCLNEKEGDHFQPFLTSVSECREAAKLEKKITDHSREMTEKIKDIFIEGARLGNCELIERYYKRFVEGKDPADQFLDVDYALAVAIQNGHYSLFTEFMKEKWLELIRKRKFKEGHSPVEAAARCEDLAFLELLEKKGFKLDEKGSNGKTPLIFAIACNHIAVANWLADRYTPQSENFTDDEGKRAFSYSLSADNALAIKLAKRVVVKEAIEGDLWAIDLAMNQGSLAVVEELYKAMPTMPEDKKVALLKWAIDEGHEEFVRKLLGEIKTASISKESFILSGNKDVVKKIFNGVGLYEVIEQFPEVLTKLAILAGKKGDRELFSMIIQAFDQEARLLLCNFNAVATDNFKALDSLPVLNIFSQIPILYAYAHIYGAVYKHPLFVQSMREGIAITCATGSENPRHMFTNVIETGSQIRKNQSGNYLVEELLWAIGSKEKELVAEILAVVPPKTLNQISSTGLTPLMRANQLTDNHELFQSFVEHAHVDLSVRNHEGLNVLLQAIERKNPANIALLAQKCGPNDLNVALIFSQFTHGQEDGITKFLVRKLGKKTYPGTKRPGWGLVYVAEMGVLPLVQKIIVKDSEKKESDRVIDILHIEMAMMAALKSGHDSIYEYLNERYKTCLKGDQEGHLLKAACRYGIEDFLDHLVNRALDEVVKPAIREAVIYRRLNVVKIIGGHIMNKNPGIIKRFFSGVDVTIAFSKKSVLMEAFNTAIIYGNETVIKYVLTNFPSFKDEAKFAVTKKEIDLALEYRQMAIAEQLIAQLDGTPTLESTIDTRLTVARKANLQAAMPAKTCDVVTLPLPPLCEYLYSLFHPEELPADA